MLATGHFMNGLAKALALSVCGILPLLAQAQVVYRSSSSASAPAGGAITYRSASSGVSGGIIFRGSATTGVTTLSPVYRSVASASAANAVLTLTINRPAGTIENDVMVATIGVSGNSPTITAPSGWSLVRRMTNAAANANSLAVYTKVATTTEPANYSWTFSASGGSAGGIQTFYNVDISAPVVTENGQTTVSGTTHATPSITTTVPNTMLVTSFTFSSSRAWNTPLVPAAPAVTERFDVRSNGNNNVGQSTAAHQGVVAAAGVVPARTAPTAVAAGSADVGNTHIMALRPALRVPRSALTLAGDFMVAAIGVQPSTAIVTAPVGWTQINRINNLGPTSNSLIIYRKFAATGEPASYLWQLSGATSVVGGIQSFVGVDTITPVDVENGQATSGLAHTAPTVITTVANTLLVGHYTFASARTWTPPIASGGDAAMIESYDVASQAAGAAGQSLEGTRIVHVAIGATALKTANASADPDAGAAHIMALRPSGTQINLSTPVALLENDVMIAAIGLTSTTVTITPPPGWVSIRRTNNAGGVGHALQIFSKVVTNPEPAIHTWTFSANASAVGGIQAFRGVDTSTPVHAEFGQATPSSLTHTAPIITTTVANTMLVGSYTLSSASTWVPQNPPGPPVAMSESYDVASLAVPNVNGQSLEGTRQLMPAAGLSTAFASRASANADFGNTHILALLPQTGSNIDLPVPPGTMANDVMIAAIGFQPNTLTITPPPGWTLVGSRIDNAAATANSLAVYQRISGATELGAYQWTFGGGLLTAAAGGIQTFSGVDTTTPIDAFSGVATVSSLNHATPTISTTVANTMIVATHTFASSATWTPPTAMTEAYDRANRVVPNAAGQSIEGSFVAQAAIGASGIKTATASANADTGNTYILALRPAIVNPAPARFNACSNSTACPTLTARLNTRISNSPFALYLTGLNVGGTVETGFNGNVAVSLVGRIAVGGPIGADNCPTGALDLNQALGTLAFASGLRTQTNVTVANAYRDVRARFVCDATNCPPAGVTACSSDNFAVRPDNLVVTPAIASPLRAGNVAIGDTFTLSVLASGNASTATSYNGTLQIDPAPVTAIISGPNNTGVLDGTFAAAVAGTASGTFGYSEAGYFRLNINGVSDSGATRFTITDPFPSDCTDDFNNTYVAANPASTVGCWFGNQAVSSNIGRFTPANFISLVDIVPVPPLPSVTPFCSASGFTYTGQAALRLRVTLEAQNRAGTRTQNYDSTYANGNGLVEILAENNNDNINLAARLDHAAAPWPVWTAGRFVVDKVGTFSRNAAPDGPYDSLEIGVRVTRASAVDGDNDGIRVTPQNITVAGRNGVLLPSPTRVRHGRGRLFNAYGSELLNLPVPFLAEYWNGSGWTVNALDSCTGNAALPLGAANAISVGLATIAPAVWATCVQDSGSPGLSGAGCILAAPASQSFREGPVAGFAGNFNLNLRAPGSGNTGAVTVTGNVPVWLQFPWTGLADMNPSARATFGINGGNNIFIYQRENY